MATNKRINCEINNQKLELEYPCSWSYKVIGEDCTLMKDAITEVCGHLEVTITHSNVSSKGKYHSLNAELMVPSENVRLEIFEKLKAAVAVKFVL